jgi:hypothetical protein
MFIGGVISNMRNQIERRKCDCCGKVVEQSEAVFGRNPFDGWLLVQCTDGNTLTPRWDNKPLDFCNVKCCIEFLTKADIHENDEHQMNDVCLACYYYDGVHNCSGVSNCPFLSLYPDIKSKREEWYGKEE